MPIQSRTKPNPKDLTGNRKRLLAEQHADELAQRKGEISMRNAQLAANLDRPIDLTKGAEQVTVAEESDEPVQVAPDFATIRIACDLEKVTIGQGTVYEEFKEGQTYRLPMAHALHLHGLGYVWQWL